MITLYNRQRTYDIDTQALRDDIHRILDELGYADFAICVWITTDRTIRYYNRTFRGKDKVTDILSFPFHPDITPGQRIIPESEDDTVLGDIIISAAQVARQARELHEPLYHRLRRLVVHGICHLLGYDHYTDEEHQQMLAFENKLLSIFNQCISEST